MNTFIYIMFFAIGTLFGSFFTLAVYRLPIKKSIVYGRSYCPNCNHRLEFLDLIPVLSYIFLGGKCRYCKQKIRIRYILLEILSGIVFLLFTMSLKINIYNISCSISNIELFKIAYLIFGLLFISTLFIIAGIDRENHIIITNVVVFGLVVEAIYIVYLYTLIINIYKYIILLSLVLILILINKILEKKDKRIYSLEIIMLITYLAVLIKLEYIGLSMILTLVLVSIIKIDKCIKNKRNTNINKNTKEIKDIIDKKDIKIYVNKNEKLPIGFYLCCINIVLILVQNYIFFK